MDPSDASPFARLQRALELYRRHRDSGADGPEQLLQDHPELRDLLEPLVQDEGTDECAPDGSGEERWIGEFRLVRELGRGGMGVVFEAEQVGLDRRVALKVLPPERVDARSLARFKREALAGGRLDHPAVVSVLACGEDQGRHWIAQELVGEGRTLEDRIEEARRRSGLDAGYYREVAGIAAELAEALAVAHAAGIVHRDVKPGNVLFTDDGRPKLADFGLARLADSLTISRSGAFLGTPFYMSPEQAAGGSDEEVGPASDQFSLGATLYEALTLRRPFEGDSSQHVLRKVRDEEPAEPWRLHGQLPRELSAICSRALEKDPRRRYPSVRELGADLRAFLEGRPVTARPPGRFARTLRAARRRPLRLVGAAVLFVGLPLVGGLLVAMAQQRARADRSDRAATLLAARTEARRLVAEAGDLWPLEPALVERAVPWLERADALLASRSAHAAHLAELDASDASDDARDGLAREALTELMTALDVLGGDGPSALVPAVERRVVLVQELEHSTLRSESAGRRWREARAAVAADPRYAGTTLEPIFGLLPIGPDPETGLQELAHLATGTLPEREPDTLRLEPSGDTALVLVLLPAPDTGGAPQGGAPTPAPFLLSKYEMTQAQWRRVTGEDPSFFSDLPAAPLLPVEQVSWTEADEVTRRLGLRLPMELEWEWACLAGGAGPYSFGGTVEGMERHANVKDQRQGTRSGLREDFDDGHKHVAPVGSFLPNPFGLHDIHGNVGEWCGDVHTPRTVLEREAGEPALDRDIEYRAMRGGGFHRRAADAVCTRSTGDVVEFRYRGLGLRPARSLGDEP